MYVWEREGGCLFCLTGNPPTKGPNHEGQSFAVQRLGEGRDEKALC